MIDPTIAAARNIAAAFDKRYQRCEPFADNWQQLSLAAALRAVVDEVVPKSEETPWGSIVQAAEPLLRVRQRFLAIAAELDGAND